MIGAQDLQVIATYHSEARGVCSCSAVGSSALVNAAGLLVNTHQHVITAKAQTWVGSGLFCWMALGVKEWNRGCGDSSAKVTVSSVDLRCRMGGMAVRWRAVGQLRMACRRAPRPGRRDAVIFGRIPGDTERR